MAKSKTSGQPRLDDGVYQIRKGQDTTAIGSKNFSKSFRALEMYNVKKLCEKGVPESAWHVRGRPQRAGHLIKTSEEVGKLMEEQDVLLSF